MWLWLMLVLLVGCAKAPTVTAGDARSAVAAGALLLDVRTPAEFSEGHLEGALNVPVQELEAKWAALGVQADREVVVYCRSGARSARAKGMLEARGVKRVIDLGAMSNWK